MALLFQPFQLFQLLFYFFVLPLAGVFPVILILDLNDSDCVILSFGSSLRYYQKLPDIFE